MAYNGDLSGWQRVSRPEPVVLEGRYARLEPLDPGRHAAGQLASAQHDGAEDRFRKGQNRDTAWFAMLDHQWPRLNAGYEVWLSPGRFGEDGQQRRRLAF